VPFIRSVLELVVSKHMPQTRSIMLHSCMAACIAVSYASPVPLGNFAIVSNLHTFLPEANIGISSPSQ
jgi:hypothetical protein